jgi:hypothetical protein
VNPVAVGALIIANVVPPGLIGVSITIGGTMKGEANETEHRGAPVNTQAPACPVNSFWLWAAPLMLACKIPDWSVKILLT